MFIDLKNSIINLKSLAKVLDIDKKELIRECKNARGQLFF